MKEEEVGSTDLGNHPAWLQGHDNSLCQELHQMLRKPSCMLINGCIRCVRRGALAPLVFLPATFPIRVLPGDKLFQNRIVRTDCTLAPVTHAFGGKSANIH